MTIKTKIEKQTQKEVPRVNLTHVKWKIFLETQLTTLILMTSTASLVLHPRKKHHKAIFKIACEVDFKVTQCVGISSFTRLAHTLEHKASPLISDFSEACRNLERFYLLFLICFTELHFRVSCRHCLLIAVAAVICNRYENESDS